MKKIRRFGDGGETIDMVAPESEETAKARLGRGSSAPEPEEPDRVFAAPDRFSGPAAKPAIISKEQREREGFTNLRDYLNAKGNLKPRPDKVNPDMGAKADAAFARERIKAVAKPTADEIANQQRKEKNETVICDICYGRYNKYTKTQHDLTNRHIAYHNKLNNKNII